MLFWSRIMIFVLSALSLVACSETKVATPIETFKTYTKAIKAKDTTTMKLLLSSGTIRMHEQEAKSLGVTVDEIVKRETLFSPDQKTVEYRDEKIDGDKATLQVKNSFGVWETLPFIREDGVWKIDKAGYAEQMMKEIDESNKKIDDLINSTGGTVPTPPGQPTP